jgi:hypothetical protein
MNSSEPYVITTYSHRRVSAIPASVQNGQGQAGILARGTKALLWRAMDIPLSIRR